MSEQQLCIICAYRATCQKQFSLPAGKKCPEFTRDLTIKEPTDKQEKKEA
ncbi:MAG: hypothetical protein N3A62_00890 [Thermodesulfovibrionales bacterium]|nr:hypothetical protein [Thermodesulfovibrionales bacterium]